MTQSVYNFIFDNDDMDVAMFSPNCPTSVPKAINGPMAVPSKTENMRLFRKVGGKREGLAWRAAPAPHLALLRLRTLGSFRTMQLFGAALRLLENCRCSKIPRMF